MTKNKHSDIFYCSVISKLFEEIKDKRKIKKKFDKVTWKYLKSIYYLYKETVV
jgi:hypothetical protein